MIGLAAGALAAGYVASGLAGWDWGPPIGRSTHPAPLHISAFGTAD